MFACERLWSRLNRTLLAKKHPEATIMQGMRATSAALIPLGQTRKAVGGVPSLMPEDPLNDHAEDVEEGLDPFTLVAEEHMQEEEGLLVTTRPSWVLRGDTTLLLRFFDARQVNFRLQHRNQKTGEA